jgi:hypothetical protein
MKLVPMIILSVVLFGAVYLDKTGTHIAGVLLGLAIAQGAVTVVAAAELSNAKWIQPVKKSLLALVPLLFLFPFLVRLAPYAWLKHENAWLRGDLFVGRNMVVLLVTAVIGWLYSKKTLAEKPSSPRWAVAYILAFVVCQTLVAMDWTMSLDYPWISTMFPVLYMVEAFYAGLALIALICCAMEARKPGSVGGTLYDGATLMFGFGLFWGGLTFAQYLTIWYANIPEEVNYFTLRFAQPAGKFLFAATIMLLFVIPFGLLLIHKLRKSPRGLGYLACLILLGVFVSRLFHMFPHIKLDFGMLAIQTVAMLGCVALLVRGSLAGNNGES